MEAKDTVTKRYLKPAHAWAYLDMGKTKFYELVKKSLIPVTVIDGVKRYDIADLDKLGKKGKV